MHFFQRPAVHLLVITLFTLVAYANSFDVPFQLDDIDNIVNSPAIKGFEHFWDIDASGRPDSSESFDKPLFKTRYIGYLTFAINYAVHGLDVRGYHLVNLLIHLCAAFLLYQLVNLTFKTPRMQPDLEDPRQPGNSHHFIAFFTALLFAVHPIQTQAVTYIVQRFASMATMLCLLSLVCYLRYRLISRQSSSGIKRSALYAGSLFSAALAMKTKEFALLLPFMAALYELLFLEGRVKDRLRSLTPLFLTIAIVPLSFVNRTGSGIGESAARISGAYGNMSSLDYLLTQFRVIVTYLRLLFFPLDQRFDYDYPVYRSFWVPEVVASFLLLLAIAVYGGYLYRKSCDIGKTDRHLYRLTSFGIFWFFLTISGESGFIPIADVIFEHRLYLPSIGFFLALVSGLELARTSLVGNDKYLLKVPVSAMLLLSMLLVIVTYARNSIWRDPLVFMQNEVRKNPRMARPHLCLGRLYGEHGRLQEALDQFNKVLSINPSDPEAHYDIGITMMRMERLNEAAAELRKSIALRYGFADAHENLGAVYSKLGMLNEAAAEYTTAIMIAPQSETARNNLGNVYLRLGRTEDAIAEFRNAIRIRPDLAEAHYNLGNALAGVGRREEAMYEYRTALKCKPGFSAAQNRLESLSRISE